MNTTKKGNEFEDRVYQLLKQAIDKGELGILGNQARLRKKPKYYSTVRESDITFDLSIEIWPPSAKRFILLFIVECKNYNHRIPIDDLEEFDRKITQVSGLNVKGLFITNADLQGRGSKYIENRGIMYIKVYDDNSYKIILHSSFRKHKEKVFQEDEIIKFESDLQSILNPIIDRGKFEIGIRKLSKDQISDISNSVIKTIDPHIINGKRKVPIRKLEEFITERLNIELLKVNSLGRDSSGRQIKASCDVERGKIMITNQFVNTKLYSFILAHELGHMILHKDLKLNQSEYEAFSDSKFSNRKMKYELSSDRDWLEWQANHFASSLILPKLSIITRLLVTQEKLRVKCGKLYLDDQRDNIRIFHEIIEKLAYYFFTTKTSVIFRLNDLGLVINKSRLKSIGQIIDENIEEFQK